MLGTVARVFDAAAAASNAEPPPAKTAGKWDSGAWRPEETGAYKSMVDRQRRRRANEREGGGKAAKPRRKQVADGDRH